MRPFTARTLAFVLVVALAPLAKAHHGKDFLLTESYEIPHPGDVYFASSVALVELGGTTEFEFEPSLLVGVLPRLAFELHAHLSDEEGQLEYEAAAPAFHFQVTPPNSDFPLRVGVSGEYEFAAASDAHDRAELRIILEREVGRSRIAFNLIAAHEFSGDSVLGYAAGYRCEITEKIAAGVEAQGEFSNDARHDLIVGIYSEPTDRLTLKTGVGAAISGSDIGPTVRAGVVFRF